MSRKNEYIGQIGWWRIGEEWIEAEDDEFEKREEGINYFWEKSCSDDYDNCLMIGILGNLLSREYHCTMAHWYDSH